MRLTARSEIQRSLPARPAERSNSGFRKTEIPASQLESATRRQQRTRPQPCKHCAASARRRSCRFSLLRLGFRPVNFLDQSLEPRLVAHAVVKLIAIDPPEYVI